MTTITRLVKILWIDTHEDINVELREVPADLDGLRSEVGGGWLEAIGPYDGSHDWTGYCDEEGKIVGLPVNVRATRLARLIGWTTGDTLNGPVVFLGPADADGNDTDVGDDVTGYARTLGYLP
ncbi:MAG: DUF3846 domain-containing protein [Rhodoglobus sp.]